MSLQSREAQKRVRGGGGGERGQGRGGEGTHLGLINGEMRGDGSSVSLRVEQPDVLGRGDRAGRSEPSGGERQARSGGAKCWS